MKSITVTKVWAREVIDSRGFPTVEAEIEASSGDSSVTFTAIVPSGASTGEGEALELRDGDSKRFLGKGVQKAVGHVKAEIARAVTGRTFKSIGEFDQAMIELDGTDNKSKLGANAILPVSMAFARAQAELSDLTLYEWINSAFKSGSAPGNFQLPVPMMNIINGGKHADNGLALQEFMIVPAGFTKFSEALRAGCEVFQQLKKILHDAHLSTGVGDEGGFAPVFPGANPHEQAIQAIMKAIDKAGYKAGEQIFLALDCAASEFCQNGQYDFEGKKRSSDEMTEVYASWIAKYPILSIEDGLAEHDWAGWKNLTAKLGSKCQLVGDDLFVTNRSFLEKGIAEKAANSILIKLNQIGSVSETLLTMKMAAENGFSAISSHRSGESEDTFIADLAVGTGCGQIKTGSLSRTDRIAKYNQLLRIEERLDSRGDNRNENTNGKAEYAGRKAFK